MKEQIIELLQKHKIGHFILRLYEFVKYKGNPYLDVL